MYKHEMFDKTIYVDYFGLLSIRYRTSKTK